MSKMKKADEELDGTTDNDKIAGKVKGEEGDEEVLNEDVGKSEDPASDEDHISHPRPEEGEEEQRGSEKVEKSEENDEEEEEELEGDTEKTRDEQEITAKKSLTTTDIEKSIAKMESLVGKTPANRKATLLAKATKGEDLNKAEKEELFGLLGSKPVEKPTLAKSVTEGITKSENIRKALDVSEYLKEQHTELTKSLSNLANYVEKSDRRQQEFDIELAKCMASVGRLVKSMSERLTVIEGQPARGPKAVGTTQKQVIQKSFAGKTESGETRLSKAQTLDAMDGMLREFKSSEDPIVAGENLVRAITSFESSNTLSPAMAREVVDYVNKNKK